MDFKVLKEELDNDQRQNFYILAGDEKEVIRKYVKRIDPNAREAESFKDLVVRFQNVGLFNNGEHGSYYIYNDKSIMDFDPNRIIRLIGPDKVIMIYDAIDGRVDFFKKMKEFIYEFPKYDAQTLSQYVLKLIDIDPDLAVELSILCNCEVARVEMECDKLQRLDQKITRDLLHELVMKTPEDVIFDMIKAAAKRDRSSAYALYDDLKERKESPVKIISLLYTTFRNVILTQSYSSLTNQEISTKTGLSSGQVYFIREMTGSFDLITLKDFLLLIQEAEINIKTGKIDQHIALEALLINILR